MDGPELGKRFVLRFTGLVPAARRRVETAVRNFKLPDGSWKQFAVSDNQGVAHPLFVSPDKNGRTAKKEFESRRLIKILREDYHGVSFYRDGATGGISSAWKPLVQFKTDPGSQPSILLWNGQFARSLGIDTEATKRKFRSSFNAEDTIVWEEI